MYDGPGAYMLSLELEAPRLRREAFPWDVAQVELSATLSSNPTTTTTTTTGAVVVAGCDRIINVRLPSVVDLSAFWPPGKDGTAEGHHVGRDEEHLEVQILGCDLGITFTLGTASVEVPTQLKPSIAQNACRSTPFRVCLRDDAGARVGTMSGAFLARRERAVNDPPSTAEHAAKQSEAGSATTAVLRRQSDGDAGDRGSLLGATKTSEELATKHDDQDVFENKAIELLDMASKILASTNSLAHRRGWNPADSKDMATSSSFEHNGATGSGLSPDQQKQATGLADEKIAPNDPEDRAYGGDGVAGLPTKDPKDKGRERKAQAPRFPTAGFRFEPTTGSVAWHRIAAVNPSKLERDGDLQTLKQFIADVAVGQVDYDDIDANPGLTKAFRLAQLQAQYLLHCQQILQRQCDGLQSTTTNMQLEVEGNSQSTTAMKNRVRLLRKESRKQVKGAETAGLERDARWQRQRRLLLQTKDKIISGYATMLRRHNPGLASKVRLDEKGRLRVFRVDEAAREWGGGRRRRRRNRSQCDIDGLQVLRVQNREKASSYANGSPTPSSSRTSDIQCPGEDRSRFSSASDNSRARGSTRRTVGPPYVEVRRESVRTNDRDIVRKSHQREESTGGVGDGDFPIQEAFVSEGGEGGDFGDADGGSGGSGGGSDSLERRRNGGNEGGETGDNRGAQTRPPRAAIAQTVEDNRPSKDMSETPPEVGGGDAGRGGTHSSIINVSATPNKTGRSGKLGCPTEHSSFSSRLSSRFSSRAGEDKNGGGSPSEGWRETKHDVSHDHDHDHDRPVHVGVQPDSSKKTEKTEEPGLESEDDASGSRAPRLVTVSVKPKSIRQQQSPDSAASSSPRFRGGEDSDSGSPRGGQASQGSAVSGSRPARKGRGRDAGEGRGSRLTHEVHSSTMAGVSRGGRPGETGGEGRQSSPAAAESSFSPSRLGIEGEGYPDALEFDLDDISEIDAGGEWAAGEGEGSSSS